jgi:hypothetical protein
MATQVSEQSEKSPPRRRGPSVRSIVEAALAAGATVVVEGGVLRVMPRDAQAVGGDDSHG